MSFLNILLLGGAFALAVPLIIHLLNRSKFQVIEWGAMHLLDDTIQQNSRRLQWQQWLLLAVRCAIPVFLALCMARPLLTAWKTGGSDSQAAMAIIMDNSYSMEAPGSSSKTNAFENASAQLETLVKRMGRGTQYALFTSGSNPFNVTEGATFDRQRIQQLAAKIHPDQGPSKSLAAIQDSLKLVRDLPQARKHVILFSDFQASDWRSIDETTLEGLRQSLHQAEPVPFLTLVNVPSKKVDNLSVRFDAEYSEIAGKSEPFEARILIRNHGRVKQENLSVLFQVDGIDLASKTLNVEPGSQIQMVFPCTFSKPGKHQLKAIIEDPSPIHADDHTELDLECVEAFRILLIDPSPVQAAMEAETAFLEIAITAQEEVDSNTTPWIRTARIHADGLTEPMVKNSDVIVVGGATKFSDAASQWIATRVAEGAGMVWFPSESTDPIWFNQHWIAPSPTPLLPMKLGAKKSTAELQGQSVTFPPAPFQDPLLSFFNSGVHGRLDRVDVTSWFTFDKLEAREGSGQSGATKTNLPAQPNEPTKPNELTKTTVLASLSNGEPWLVSAEFGKGRVLQCSTACDDDWNNAPLRPIYVPLMQRMVTSVHFQLTPNESALRIGESELELLNEGELATIAKKMDADLVDSVEGFLSKEQLRVTGRELWRWLLLLLIVFLFGELLLQRPLTRGAA